MSLPPDTWSELDRLAEGAGASHGVLLTAVLWAGLPASPHAALDAVVGLLGRTPADEGLLEERNYLLPLELRKALDHFAKMLAPGSRAPRSLVRAILVDHRLTSPDHARELVNSLRVQAMRASLEESTQRDADLRA